MCCDVEMLFIDLLANQWTPAALAGAQAQNYGFHHLGHRFPDVLEVFGDNGSGLTAASSPDAEALLWLFQPFLHVSFFSVRKLF